MTKPEPKITYELEDPYDGDYTGEPEWADYKGRKLRLRDVMKEIRGLERAEVSVTYPSGATVRPWRHAVMHVYVDGEHFDTVY